MPHVALVRKLVTPFFLLKGACGMRISTSAREARTKGAAGERGNGFYLIEVTRN